MVYAGELFLVPYTCWKFEIRGHTCASVTESNLIQFATVNIMHETRDPGATKGTQVSKCAFKKKLQSVESGDVVTETANVSSFSSIMTLSNWSKHALCEWRNRNYQTRLCGTSCLAVYSVPLTTAEIKSACCSKQLFRVTKINGLY